MNEKDSNESALEAYTHTFTCTFIHICLHKYTHVKKKSDNGPIWENRSKVSEKSLVLVHKADEAWYCESFP